ncbi:nuclear pore complex protein Nup133 [Zootermopsis nevadensis]|uniref:nuclear pore complex protein Nup133 n=1 Tax=Zootermopsis nevadensis TaxID=136037 RepID=UPI000B8E2C9D|nr:nuclear pore complex protein Nup133 [Zootermopsis nevadensis]
MDRGGSPFTPKSLLSPRIPRTAASSRRSGILPSVKKPLGRFSLSGRSNQSVQVVFKTAYHIVESFGSQLPVLVTEALTFSDRSTAVSVHISVDGWAWFVCGRRLLIWQYKQALDAGKQRRVLSSQCQELTLPPSDLAHKADLVSVYIAEGSQVPSCIAVSPEGTVRYWPSIAHEGTSVEDNADLQGQECDSLTDIAPVGCILATTTSTIVLVQPQITGGRHSIVCRTLKTPQGWLGGIGRRMSSLIFGGLPSSQIMETKLVKVVAVAGSGFESDEWRVYVLAEQSLQKWILVPGEVERLVYEFDVNRMVREAFHETVWESSVGSLTELRTWLLDMQPVDGGLMLLVAAVNTQMSPQLHYALGKLSAENMNPPVRFSAFFPLKNTGFYRDEDEAELLSYQFLLVGPAAYVYNQRAVVAVSAMVFNEEPDNIEFLGPGDRVLGGAVCGNVAVFFSKVHGLVSVSPSDFSPHDMNSSMSFSEAPGAMDVTGSQFSEDVNISVTDVELEELTINKDGTAQMKAAFIYYIKKNLTQSEAIVSEMFPPEEEPVIDIDAALDTIAVKVSEDLVNDIPSGDPRWAEMKAPGVSIKSSSSLHILHQLEDKQKALELYISFLKDLKLWNRFSAVTSRGVVMATSYVLAEHAEKLVAIMTLRQLQANHSTVIDTAIKYVVAERPLWGLTCQDLFFREVTEVHHIIQVLSKRPQEVANVIAETNTVILAVLQEVIQFRQKKADVFCPNSPGSAGIGEYLPWTAASGKGGLRESLLLQQNVTLKYGAHSTSDSTLKNQLCDQLLHLIDIILDGRKCYLESVRGTEKFDVLLQQYETERHAIIQQFLEDEEFERAAILAEKYCDFQILIQICELTSNWERLDQYMEKFSEQDFSQFLFGWYIREQKQGKLLEQFRNIKKSRAQQHALSQFLVDHPSLSWLQDIFSGDYKQAGSTLRSLAKEESELLQRKKSILSLAKLALLASDEQRDKVEDQVQSLNADLDLVSYQEELPEVVLSSYGYDVERLRVLTPTELVKLYVCDENSTATEYDFKKALELLAFIEDEFERSELRHKVWCQAVLRDNWTDANSNSPLEVIQGMTFFRLADLMAFMGCSPDEVLPPLERMLEAQELGSLKDNSSFQYLLKVGYEHVRRTLHTDP